MIYSYHTWSSPPYNSFLLTDKDWKRRELEVYSRHLEERLNSDNPFKRVSYKENWIPIEVNLYSKAKSRKIPDLSDVNELAVPVFSEKAINVLGEILEKDGELLEIHCVDDDKTYYVYNVMTYVDIIDDELTKIETEKTSRITLNYKSNVDFNNLGIFRIFSELNYLISNVYIGQQFVDLVNKYKLTGDLFRPINYINYSVDIEKNKELVQKFEKRMQYYKGSNLYFPYWKWEKENP